MSLLWPRWPQQIELKSEPLNYATHKEQHDSFRLVFLLTSFGHYFLPKTPLKAGPVVSLRGWPVAVRAQNEPRVFFGQRLGEGGSK